MMAVKIINQESLAQERFRLGHTSEMNIFKGSKFENRDDKSPVTHAKPQIIKMGAEKWVGSAGYHKLRNEINVLQRRINAAQSPTSAEITALLGKMFIDYTRRAQEAPDLTSRICTEITDLSFDKTINLREIYKYRGYFDTISGANDSVPLIEQATGTTDTVDLAIYALGWKDSLANMLFNRLHTMDKVNQAVVDADTDLRNSKVIGAIVGATFVASQKQAADTTSGATYDVKMYSTFRKAIKKLRRLLDYRTTRKIATPSIAILCNSYDSWSIQRVIGGQLQTGGTTGVINSQNVQALPISEIIEYDQGINNGFAWGEKTLSFSGVTAGTCYVFVPREYAWVMNKRPLTMETSRGTALQLSTEERAWYRVQAEFLKVLLGSSYTGTELGAGYGAIVEVTLPTDS
jgi:hypothetical protein